MTTGTTVRTAVPSAALGEPIACTVYLPPGYERHGGIRYPVLYLLHGRGDSMRSFDRAVAALDGLIGDGRIPPFIAVAPDAPWSGRASWYVDSAYTGGGEVGGGAGGGQVGGGQVGGSEVGGGAGGSVGGSVGGEVGAGDGPGRAGRPVETALVRDLVPAVDATYRTIPTRDGRLVGGYSMGGAGALRLALAHQRLFACALVLSPAVYTPLPPAGSNTRVYGAYGSGARAFDEDVYRRLNYPALLPSVDPALPLHLFIAVGQGDYTDPASRHDIGSEHEALYEAARLTPGIHARARVFPGGHDWDTWLPALVEGVSEGLAVLRPPQDVADARPAGAAQSARPAGAARFEPARFEPARSEPARSQAARSEPARFEPARSQAARSQAARSEPARSQPAHVKAPPDLGATAPSKDTP
jgi:enterochelin esterase-like enzyme